MVRKLSGNPNADRAHKRAARFVGFDGVMLACCLFAIVVWSLAFTPRLAVADDRVTNFPEIDCPAGSFLAGMTVRKGAWLDKVGIMCAVYNAEVDEFGRAKIVPGSPMYGGDGGSPAEAPCPSHSAVQDIKWIATRAPDEGHIDNLVMDCRDSSSSSIGYAVINTEQDGTTDGDIIGDLYYGVGQGNNNWSYCYRAIAIGISGTLYQNAIQRINLHCKDPHVGETASPLTTAPLPPQGPIDTSGGAASFPLGVGSGPPINVDCAAGEALVGLQAQGASYIDQVQIHCARFDGRAVIGPMGHRGDLGSSTGPVSVADCPPSSVVVAGDGDTSSYQNMVTRIRLRCGDGASTPYAGAVAPSNMQTWTHRVLTCGPGNVAVGIYGWLNSDRTLKAIGLRCRPGNRFAGGDAPASSEPRPAHFPKHRYLAPISRTLSVTCTSSGQVCLPAGVVTVPSDGTWSVQVTPSAAHCSRVAFEVKADGTIIGRSDYMGPGQPTQNSPVPQGAHELTVQGVGVADGCNHGRLGSWQADVTLTPR